jgi:TolA-binding protein
VLKDFRSALVSFKKLGGRNPTSARAAEALLAIANCHLELKDTANARKALEELLSSYPQSEVAEVAKERLTRIK